MKVTNTKAITDYFYSIWNLVPSGSRYNVYMERLGFYEEAKEVLKDYIDLDYDTFLALIQNPDRAKYIPCFHCGNQCKPSRNYPTRFKLYCSPQCVAHDKDVQELKALRIRKTLIEKGYYKPNRYQFSIEATYKDRSRRVSNGMKETNFLKGYTSKEDIRLYLSSQRRKAKESRYQQIKEAILFIKPYRINWRLQKKREKVTYTRNRNRA